MPLSVFAVRFARPITSRLVVLFVACGLAPCALASSSPDNRYCGPGNQPKFGAYDGPAALPQSCFFTALSATPSPGQKIQVSSGSNLQHAIDQAKCGDTLELAAGAEFRGEFHFPAKGCDDAHWITVQSDGQIPPEGARITPCYAGVKSLPGRPDFSCASLSKAMATLVVPPHGTIRVADHYRLIGLEITRAQGGIVYSLVSAEKASKLVFDRIWAHGDTSDETTRGIGFPGAAFIAVIDSYFSDFHCTARVGACVDSQALWAGTGPIGGGTYKIVNNFLEAGGENILMGGGPGSATPADLEIRQNHFFKPTIWQHAPDPRLIVKNNFELKNGMRVLLEGNLLENSWGGFTQQGFQILLTPKSQNNLCPLCIVRDVTIRYCVMRHSGAGIQIATAASDSGGLSQGLMNVSIHDVLIQDIDSRRYDGNGATFQISSAGGAFANISLRHITAPISDRLLFIIGGPPGRAAAGMLVADNILGSGQYQVISTGGHSNCAYQRTSAKDIFDACWTGYRVTGNLFIGGSDKWPDGNRSVKDLKLLGWQREIGSSEPGEMRLPANSEHRVKTTDGRDPGADIPRILSLLDEDR